MICNDGGLHVPLLHGTYVKLGTISMASLPYVRIINTLILLNRGVSVTGGGLGVFLAVAPLCNVVDSD